MSRFLIHGIAALLLLGAAPGHAEPGAASPVPLTIYAIWEGAFTSNEEQLRAQMDNLVRQFGPGNAWHRPGFAFIYQNPVQMRLIARIAKEKGISLGVIFAIQTHSRGGGGRDYFAQDLRSFQWRMNSRDWMGYYTGKNNTGTQEIPEDGRDYCVPSPSRYSPLAQRQIPSLMNARAREVRQIMDEYPGVITCINGVIEEELAVATASIKTPNADDYLADYSPFAVTEFRDWLRHTGMYDDATGKYAGQGAPEAITGPFVEIGGKLRSPFYDDADPDSDNGTGKSFNATFGTSFHTWNLKYWDTALFPDPITNESFNPIPASGEKGYTDGGFDAPRKRDHSPWWHAWSWDYADEGNTYPPGNPAVPAFGFRQVMVAHFVRDMFDVVAAAGLPREITYAHQIPGEQVGIPRCRSGASPVWTGYLPANGTVGVTCFGWIDPQRLLQYANLTPDNRGWGIFEWHPRPNSRRDDPKLYDAAMKELIVYSRNGCRHLFAGWWNLQGKETDPQTFWLRDSKFAEAIKAFMGTTPDNPPPMPAEGGGDVGKIR